MTRWTAAAVLAVMLVSAHHPVPAAAQTSDAVGVVTTLDGRASVARPALNAPLALKFKDDVFGRDRISTEENSLVRVLLGGKAILTVRELSQVTINEEPGRAVVTLPSGKVVLAVAKQRMRPGESIEIRTPNAVAAVRGSILAVAYDAAQNLTTAICHSGDCTYQYAGGSTNPLPPGQGGKNGQVGPVSQAERDAAVTVQTSTKAFSSPDAAFVNGVFQTQAGQAIQVAQFVTGGPVPPVPTTVSPTPTTCCAPVNGLTGSSGNLPPGPTASGGGGNGGGGNGSGGNGGGGSGLIVNGGFETGDFTGWTRSGNSGFTSVTSSSFYVNSGTFGASLGPVGSDGILSQTLQTTPGKAYIVSFALRSDGLFTNDFSASWDGQTFFSRVNMPNAGFMPLSFTEVATGSSTTLQLAFRDDPGFLGLDDVSVISDPPLYFLGTGDSLTHTGSDPLLRLSGTPQTFDSLMIVCCGARARFAGPLLQATNSDLTVPFSLVSAIQGGSLVSTTTDPLVQLAGGTHSLGSMGLPIFEIAGVNTAVDASTGLTLGTDQPLQTQGVLLDTSQATVNAHQAVRVDNALLEASAPLLALRAGTQMTTATDAIQLSYQATVTSLGSIVRLDRSALTVAQGAALNLAGGSVLRVTGDLFSLINGSTLSLLNGPLVSLSGGSILSVNGALVGFGGTGGNLVSVANSLCPCTTIGGLPVSLTNGALASNVTIAGAIKNSGLGSLNVAPNAAVIRVDGAGTRVTLNGM
jgi:FecR-like protein